MIKRMRKDKGEQKRKIKIKRERGRNDKGNEDGKL